MIPDDVGRRPRWRSVRVLTACLALVAILTAGCGHKHDLAPVSGRVTVQGKPVAEITVNFQPKAAPGDSGDAGIGSLGVTDADGRFTLKTIDGRPGAVVGTHVVRLNVPDRFRPGANSDERTGPPPRNPFPAKAYEGGLGFEVPADGTDQANFDF